MQAIDSFKPVYKFSLFKEKNVGFRNSHMQNFSVQILLYQYYTKTDIFHQV